MQDRYVGDVGDFGKYALLRRLCGQPRIPNVRLGVVWCLFPNENLTGDGRHVSYLYSPKFLDLDDQLLLTLRALVETDQRRVSAVATAGILPRDTVFFDAYISSPAADHLSRVRDRSAWLEGCIRLTRDCELVFFDPDNGLAVPSVPKQHPRAGKYIYWDELAPFWRQGKSLLIYHHLNRTVSAAEQIETLALQFAAEFDRGRIIPLVFRRGSSRVFWLAHHGDCFGCELEKRAADLLNGGWSQHFRPWGWPSDDQASTRAS
jgi:hypothetical protein